MITSAEFEAILASPEGRNVEFKEAKSGYNFGKLVDYCVALANAGGGTFVLGVSDKRPRQVVGTKAFSEPGRTEAGLFEKLNHRVPVEELQYEGKRILLVRVPSRLPGTAWQHKGAYLMRAGDALVPMSDDQLRRIHMETGPDFSAEICEEATLKDLDPDAIDQLQQLWQRKSPDQDVRTRLVECLLADAELLVGGELTYAALILLGTRRALGRFLGQAEVIFEYRPSEVPGPAAERREFRAGFLPFLDQIWQAINLRNDLQHFQQGLFVWDVPTFNERAVREAVLNAVSHRDYRLGGSVFVRQYPRRIEIVSPGGLPAGINQENILWEQNPRNRRIAEVLARCGLVERAGQGFDLIYRECIRQSKPLPDFSRTSEHSVWITLHGEIQDPEFLRFLEEVGGERQATFTTEDYLVIDLVHREQAVPEHLAPRLRILRAEGIIERVGRGRGVRHLLSKRFYRFLGKGGTYTRRKGLDRETNKALLRKHIENSTAGAALAELQQVLPHLNRSQIQGLLRELKAEGQIRVEGERRWARWFVGSRAGNIANKSKEDSKQE
ncbi:MAG: putative DNA binding domain-containing protein [Candidatus Krumholzibacteriota bacterium]|nr:putative DNA binding domain-containing protein [Candidatus Krumholzibacteriota bacterium]